MISKSWILRGGFLLVASALVPSRLGLLEQAQAALEKSRQWTERSADEIKKTSVDVEGLNRAFVSLAESMKPAVVNIYTKTKIQSRGFQGYNGMAPDELFRFFFGNPLNDGGMRAPAPREAQALGSGFVINNEGLIITNSHVVRMSGRNADSIMVKFIGDSEKSPGWEAKVLGVDESTDVALIKLNKKKADLKVTPLGDSSKVKVGEWVVAIGNPYGHMHSVTKGIVSALGRSLEEIDRSEFIQTDASINPGNSGGPLFNLYGEVIGINTAIDARAQGIGFAIPINTAKNVVQQIVEKGEVSIGWVGIEMSELNPQMAEALGLKSSEGVLVQGIFEGGPAARGGIKTYDVITEVNGQTISGSRDFARIVRNLSVGAKAKINLLREGKVLSREITIGKFPRSARPRLEESEAPRLSRGVESPTGVVMTELTSMARRKWNIHPSVQGVLVEGVRPKSLAARAGLREGDVIREIDRKAVSNVGSAEKALSKQGKSLLLQVQRGSASMIILMDLSQANADDGE